MGESTGHDEPVAGGAGDAEQTPPGDDTAAFQRFYAGDTPPARARRGLLARLFGGGRRRT